MRPIVGPAACQTPVNFGPPHRRPCTAVPRRSGRVRGLGRDVAECGGVGDVGHDGFPFGGELVRSAAGCSGPRGLMGFSPSTRALLDPALSLRGLVRERIRPGLAMFTNEPRRGRLPNWEDVGGWT